MLLPLRLFLQPQILVIFFNLCWIAFTLDHDEDASKDCAAAPITGDVEAASTQK
jgi:hypothetical protein